VSTISVDVSEVPGRLQELLSLVRAGTEVVVRDGDRPAVRMLPADPPLSRREWVFNMHPGAMVMREDFDDYIDEEDFLAGNF
jgi:antitoxin (DNA-binding transcriptional repressor) of toxin-antitoxin stability system